MNMRMKLRRFDLRHELGPLGVAAFVVLAAALAFVALAVQPLEAKSRSVAARLARSQAFSQESSSPAQKLEEFYNYLAKPEQTTDWLAKLYAIGHATGVELQSATYRSEQAGRIERYQIQLPVSGSYAQMREFLDRALAEIPVLSLDQMTLKRESRRDGAVQAELKLTLHMVKEQ
jgi:Tfp pilus assembly protein PilO